MSATTQKQLFDPRLPQFLIGLKQMADYFSERFNQAEADKKADPMIEHGTYDEIMENILKLNNAIAGLIVDDIIEKTTI